MISAAALAGYLPVPNSSGSHCSNQDINIAPGLKGFQFLTSCYQGPLPALVPKAPYRKENPEVKLARTSLLGFAAF